MRHEVLLSTSTGRHMITIDDAFVNSLSGIARGNTDSVGLFVASWLTLLSDSPLDPHNKPLKTYRDLLRSLVSRGLKTVVMEFSELAHKLVSNEHLYGSESNIRPWIDGFKDTPVFFEYNRYFHTGDIGLLRFLYTWLNFGKKLFYVDPAFEKAAFRSWSNIEDELNDLILDNEDVASLRLILKTLLPSFRVTDFRPKFGPGSVAERRVRGRLGKLRTLAYDPLIDRFLLKSQVLRGCAWSGLDASAVIPDSDAWSAEGNISSRISRLHFVPKNLKVARSICMEPNTLMFIQQGVLREMLRLIDSSALGSFIRLSDQGRNRSLAEYGSYTGSIDTLDLSAASDRVSVELVRKIFPASWLIPLLVTRTSRVELPDGTVRVVKKFAPMGSALCFPTQCLIFSSVGVYAACRYVYETDSCSMPFSSWLTPDRILRITRMFNERPGYTIGAFEPMAIYGDDICVDRRLTQNVKSILVRLGFDVNNEKSFVDSQAFRESCGGYYLNGHDITPVYFRVRGSQPKLTAEFVASYVSYINTCYERGLWKSYSYARRLLMTWGLSDRMKKCGWINQIPYVEDKAQWGILHRAPMQDHILARRYNADLQRTEVRILAISRDYSESDKDLLSLLDKYEYVRWWASRNEVDSSADQKAALRYDTGGARLVWRWIPDW